MWKETNQSPYYLVNENGDVKRKEYTRVDKLGRKTLVKEKLLKQYYDKDGYLRVRLVTGLKKPIFIPTHRVIAQAFIENPNNYTQINHKDEDRANNNVNNLEWCTIQYNNAYGTHNERNKKSNQINNGKRIKAIKDNKEQIFISVREASRQLNLNYSNIFSCLSGRLQHTGGYAFKEVI